MIILEEGLRPTFGGHEKFVFRHGWLKKGLDAANANPVVFTEDTALVTLGVGKNMVRSIRHWCLATNLLKEDKTPGHEHALIPSELGKRLLLKGGWDPFIEDTGTLWLLHWQLVSNQMRSLVWHVTFSAYLVTEFSKKQLVDYIHKEFEHVGLRVPETSIEREVDCCLRTYVPARNRSGALSQDTLDCPLAELELLRYYPDENIYRYNVGPKLSLPVPIFGYALITFLYRIARTRRTVSVEECAYQYGSPGQAFKLDENSVVEYLEALEELTQGRLRLMETAGLRQIYFTEQLSEPFRQVGLEILQKYYEQQ